MTSSHWIRHLRPIADKNPVLKTALKRTDQTLGTWKHSLAAYFPALIRPDPRQLTVAVTAKCNLRCAGCRYGRDFMLGQQLPLSVMLTLLDDARDAGISTVRFYGGEPLLHPDLATVIAHSTRLGFKTYVTTNGTLLGERFEALHSAGLRTLTIGFYGTEEEYDEYTGRRGQYDKLRAGLAGLRDRYGHEVELQLNWVLLRPTCNLQSLRRAWTFAEDYQMFFHLDLWGYSIPFFSNGSQQELAFHPEDRAIVEEVADELVRMRDRHPDRFPQPTVFLRSVPDWLLLGPEMRVPCDAYQLIWVGADGSVQLCDTSFPLGNLHENRLRDILFGGLHRTACRDAFQLKCPNCTCKVDSRILKHAPSLARYRR